MSSIMLKFNNLQINLIAMLFSYVLAYINIFLQIYVFFFTNPNYQTAILFSECLLCLRVIKKTRQPKV
jgi:hypothetical protein